MKSFLLIFALICAPLFAFAGDVRLLMFEEAGCYWCGRWNSEISPIYPKTVEGKTAVLERVDVHDPIKTSWKLKSRPVFTPTFVLIKDNQEIDRIEGYPGEDFFWSLLDRMLIPLPEYQKTKDAS